MTVIISENISSIFRYENIIRTTRIRNHIVLLYIHIIRTQYPNVVYMLYYVYDILEQNEN